MKNDLNQNKLNFVKFLTSRNLHNQAREVLALEISSKTTDYDKKVHLKKLAGQYQNLNNLQDIENHMTESLLAVRNSLDKKLKECAESIFDKDAANTLFSLI
jgi:hypothetical protein